MRKTFHGGTREVGGSWITGNKIDGQTTYCLHEQR